MTSDEIKVAMKNGDKVVYNGFTYDRIEEYVLTFDQSGHQRRSLGLIQQRPTQDGKTVSTIVRVPADMVKSLDNATENLDISKNNT